MTKRRSTTEAAAGKVISAIQHEWIEEAGTLQAKESEEVLMKSHYLLQASKRGALHALLDGKTIIEYLGRSWVERHQAVCPAVEALEQALGRESA